ncbi:unnamed protein product [Sphagnum balticum]
MNPEAAYEWLVRPNNGQSLGKAIKLLGEDSPQVAGIRQAALKELLTNTKMSLASKNSSDALSKALNKYTAEQQKLLFPHGMADDLHLLGKETEFIMRSLSDEAKATFAAGFILGQPFFTRIPIQIPIAFYQNILSQPATIKYLALGLRSPAGPARQASKEILKDMIVNGTLTADPDTRKEGQPKEMLKQYGDELLEKPRDWKESIEWAHLTVLTGNSSYPKGLEECFDKYPIFGTNEVAAELELDRGIGQQALQENGIEILPYTVVDSADEAVEFILMLQEKVEGIEMGIAGWFGPGGWSKWFEESFEHKKFLVGDLGENTGEMGTVIRHVKKSLLVETMLEPLTDLLAKCEYTGDCSVNCIIDDKGQAWPLEFTMRLGWPDFCIRQALIQGDPLEWIFDLLHGRDTLEVSSDIATGILMAHGDFPKSKDHPSSWSGFPLYGAGAENKANLHFQQVMGGKGPVMKGKQIAEEDMILTAGNYVLVDLGRGKQLESHKKPHMKL